MQCIKTGFTIYISSLDKFTCMDLFYDYKTNMLYSNNNDLLNGRPEKIDIECIGLVNEGRYNQIIDPIIHKSLIQYVAEMPYKGVHELAFLANYTEGAV